ncbi:MAG: ATP-dependent DNA helicase RecQ [Chloroflexi bacterium]|nr:ATP-dependent DNA helicase RecQ [Chloroflexota bacterium]
MTTPTPPDDLTTTLRANFGFRAFRPGQEKAVQSLLDGEDTLAVMPTGAGKSLIYQLTALHRPGPALVISPLIALMKDQVDHLTAHSIPATYINSTLSSAEQSQRLQAMTRGEYRLVYVAPERLRSVPFQRAIQDLEIGLLAVDEAHCLSEWGHDFRPDYLNIAEARREMGEPLTAALTATATPTVQGDIARLLELPHMRRIVTGFNRPNLAFMVRYTYSLAEKLRALRDLFSPENQPRDQAAIVYTGTRREAEEVADFLREVARIPVEFYHAGLPGEERTRIQNAFQCGDLNAIASTNAFGMGIDRPDVRQVIHYAIPSSLEAYYQQAGRAGRDGEPAQVTLLYAPEDRALQEWFIENSAPTTSELRQIYETITSSGRETLWLSNEYLSRATALHEVKINVILSHLEEAGALEHLGDEGTRMLLRPGVWKGEAIAAIMKKTEAHRQRKEAQLKKMIAYAEGDTCRREVILDHFGDTTPPQAARCCDNCLSQEQPLPETSAQPLATEEARVPLVILDAVRRLGWEVGQGKLAKMLAGSEAKSMRNAGYTKNIYYGRLEDFRQKELKNLIRQLIQRGYFKVIGGEYPSLHLTPRGKDAIAAKATIPLDFPNAQKIRHRRAKRKAGGTVGYTAQLFDRGLNPQEIAAHRGLTVNTIYKHAAELIEEGKVALDQVVTGEVVAQIHAVLESMGEITYLRPIKDRLPESISFGEIRCVLAIWDGGETDDPHPGELAFPLERGETSPLERSTDASPHKHSADAFSHEHSAEAPLPSSSGIDRSRGSHSRSSQNITDIIIACVDEMPGELPRSGVAKVLVGSDSQRVEEYQGDPFFGYLDTYGRGEVTSVIDHLIEEGILALDGNKVIPGPEKGKTLDLDTVPVKKQSERVYQLGESGSPHAVPELVAALESSNGNVRRLAASALGKISDPRAVEPLMGLLAHEKKPQVRQYTVKALGKIGDPRPRELLETIAADSNERGYTQESARVALKKLLSKSRTPGDLTIPLERGEGDLVNRPTDEDLATPLEQGEEEDAVSAYLARPHPRPLPGPWEAGWALGFHSRFSGEDWGRTPVGELAYRLKYQGDQSALEPLVERALAVCQENPLLSKVEAVLPVPPSTARDFDPVSAFSKAMTAKLETAYRPVLVKTRQTAPQKEFNTLAQKRANVKGAFAVQGQLREKNLLVIDDLYDSGATLEEVTRVLRRAGAKSICVLTCTRTIHSAG